MPEITSRLSTALADRYTIEREIGSGGMATVYRAEDLKHHRKVAVKILRPELAVTLGPERFVREIEIAAGLTHPHILPLHDSGEADGFLYYVMPHVEGESLRERLDRDGKLFKGGSREVMPYAEKRGSHQPRLDLERLLAVIVLRVAAQFGFLQIRVLWIRGTYIPARINISA